MPHTSVDGKIAWSKAEVRSGVAVRCDTLRESIQKVAKHMTPAELLIATETIDEVETMALEWVKDHDPIIDEL